MEQAIVKCLLTAEADLAVFYGGLAKNPNENLYRSVVSIIDIVAYLIDWI